MGLRSWWSNQRSRAADDKEMVVFAKYVGMCEARGTRELLAFKLGLQSVGGFQHTSPTISVKGAAAEILAKHDGVFNAEWKISDHRQLLEEQGRYELLNLKCLAEYWGPGASYPLGEDVWHEVVRQLRGSAHPAARWLPDDDTGPASDP